MSLVDKAKAGAGQAAGMVKAGAGQAAEKAKEQLQELQAKRELGKAYAELGERTFELVERGEISNDGLNAALERVRTLRQEADESPAEDPPPAEATAPAPEDTGEPG